MKVLVFYPEDDLNEKPEIYDVSTPEKLERVYLAIFRFIRDVHGAFASLEGKAKALRDLLKRKSDLIRAMKKLGKEDRPAILGAINALQEDIDDLSNTNTLEEDYDSDDFKGIQELFTKANCGDGKAAEKLLRTIAYWSGDNNKIYSSSGYVWTIVNVKNCS